MATGTKRWFWRARETVWGGQENEMARDIILGSQGYILEWQWIQFWVTRRAVSGQGYGFVWPGRRFWSDRETVLGGQGIGT